MSYYIIDPNKHNASATLHVYRFIFLLLYLITQGLVFLFAELMLSWPIKRKRKGGGGAL